MMNLVSFETPPLRSRQESAHATTTTTTPVESKDASSRSTFFDGHLDLSLGMSMSRGGSGCDAARCSSGTKARDSGHRGGGFEVGCLSSGITTVTPDVELSTGQGHVGDLKEGAAWTLLAFMESTAGFMHPWSLAARQQKAVAEKDRRRTPAAAYMPR
jgi:auxin-responsive protein IAA